MADDNEELRSLMSTHDAALPAWPLPVPRGEVRGPVPTNESDAPLGALEQWGSSDGRRFVGTAKTRKELPPGLYDIKHSPSVGIYFEMVTVKTEGLLRFPDTNSGRVVREIQTFWERRDRFTHYGLLHKRGILLWGPPGSGKSCTIALALADVVARGGIAVRMDAPGLFLAGMRVFRDIQRDTPAVVLMEDIDSIIRMYSESEVLNILDGVELVDRTVFLASTNYPELLGPRIVNRPSRFDKRFKVGLPSMESRRMYLDHLVGKDPAEVVDLERWTRDTDGFSLAHLKELFVAVVILGDDYDEALRTLRSMREEITSDRDGRRIGIESPGPAAARNVVGLGVNVATPRRAR